MSPFVAELVGTALLIVLGDGVVANVVLNKTKGNNSGWIVITFGWGIAVFVGVYAATTLGSGGHLNPAVTIALASLGQFEWSMVGQFIAAQMIGAMAGAFVVWLCYRNHFDETDNAGSQLAVFSTGPAIRSPLNNFINEVVGTFVLVIGVLLMSKAEMKLGTLDALPVGLLVLGIGLSLGGTTGYAINPARDLGPRIMHAVLPMKHKGSSDWGYAWIPVCGPILGGVLATLVFRAIS
jgi:glycerol uptake facilitator protein